MADLDKILQDSNDIKAKWTTFLAFPYARAFANALTETKKTADAQKVMNAKKAEFGLLALSICSGGVLTQVFAQTTWKAVASAKALDVICAKNWEKAFKVAHFTSTNKVANFVVGGLWDTGAKLIDDKTKKLFAQTSASFPSTQKWKNETAALTSLVGFVNECYLKYRDTARNIFGNSKLSTTERDSAIKKLTSSKFAKPPSFSTVDESKVAQEIELLFYLRMIMDLDFLSVGYPGKMVDIKEAPNSAKYPKKKIVKSHYGNSVDPSTLVRYKELGMAYYRKVNKLHKALFKTKLLDSEEVIDIWSAKIDKKAFEDSFKAIQKLEERGMTRFRKSLALK